MNKRMSNLQTLTARREPVQLIQLPPSVTAKASAAANPAAQPERAIPETVSEKAGRAFEGLKTSLAHFAHNLRTRALLVTWEAGGMTGTVGTPDGWMGKKVVRFSAPAVSHATDFGQALGEVLKGLRKAGITPPKTLLIASPFIVPAQMDLPIDPQKPRPAAQMWEMSTAEMEAPVSEAGAIWTIGAVLAARGLLSQKTREDVALELSIRRETSNSHHYFGQTACDLGFIARQDLDEALRLQEKLQSLEARLACGWIGRAAEEAGEEPVWLAAATTLSNWKSWETAAKAHRLKLAGALPFALTVSDVAEEAGNRLALEIHAEEIMLAARTDGRITACHTEGRMGRPLDVDWFLAQAEEARARGVEFLEIVCLDAGDEATLTVIRDKLAETLGKPVGLRNRLAAQQAIHEGMWRVWQDGQVGRVFLPRIRFGAMPVPVWKKPFIWRIAAVLITFAIIAGVHFQQHTSIKQIQARFDMEDLEAKKQTLLQQEEAKMLTAGKELQKLLQSVRATEAAALTLIEHLSGIERTVKQMPTLLRTIARNIGDDVVLESIRSAKTGYALGQVQITGWSPSYTGAQSFALAMQKTLGSMGYTVAGAEVKAAQGRMERPGYQVVFWLLPSGEELDAEAVPAVAPAAPAPVAAEPVAVTPPVTEEEAAP